MHYAEYLSEMKECPFCSKHPDEILEEGGDYLITYAKAPYTANHLLVIPKRHVDIYRELTPEERASLAEASNRCMEILTELGMTTHAMLLREGPGAGKSIDHVHIHIIPEITMGPCTGVSRDRPMLTKAQEEQIRSTFRPHFHH